MEKQDSFWKERSKNYSKLEWIKDDGYANAMMNLVNPNITEKLLDIGCGECSFLNKIAHLFGEVYGIDKSEDMITESKGQYNVRLGDARDIPFPDSSFDVVNMRMILHHVLDYREKAINEAYRILKPNGRLIIAEAVPPEDIYIEWFHKMLSVKEERVSFTRKNLVDLVRSAPFKEIIPSEYIIQDFNLMNWLQNGVNKDEERKVLLDMHKNMPCKKEYNYRENAEGIFIKSFHYLVLGRK